jgi:serine/threonine-protein kinase RsbW
MLCKTSGTPVDSPAAGVIPDTILRPVSNGSAVATDPDIAPAQRVGGERLERHAPADPQAVGVLRRELGAFAMRLGAGDAVREAVMLAVSEALTNVVVHAYVDRDPGAMSVEAWPDEDGHLRVLICDEGRGMVPRTDSPGLGVGLSLMAQTADEVRVANRHDAPGGIVSLRFALRRGPPVDLSARRDAVRARNRVDAECWLDEGGGFSGDAETQ